MSKLPKYKLFAYISFGFLGLMLLFLGAIGIVGYSTGGETEAVLALKIGMYVSFGLSAAAFVISYIFDIKRRNDDRK